MKLSEHLKQVEAWIAEHSDVEIMKVGMEEGAVDFDTPEVSHLIDGVVVQEYEYLSAASQVIAEDAEASYLNDVWAQLDEEMHAAWGSRECFDDIMSVSLARARTLVENWGTAPKVILV